MRCKASVLAALGLAGTFLVNTAFGLGLTVSGVNKDGTTTSLTSYRWVIEEDTTYHPEDTGFTRDVNTLGLSFHASYMPVVATGTAADIATVTLPDPNKHYFISVLPDPVGTTKYSIGGAQIAPGQETVTVHVNANPIPTAQITFFVFEDNFPLNNAPDLPEEEPCVGTNTCMDGFAIQLEDAGGSYGASAGRASQDAFGNPIGTTYLLNPDGSFVLDADGLPVVDVLGDGVVYTGPDGRVTIKYLAPGKYGTIIVPPAGMGWQQTTTIEGTKVIDAWVKANEPPFFAEFGPPGEHVFAGFIRPFEDRTVLIGGSTISGQVVNNHMSRPPEYTIYRGFPFDWTTAWVGLNDLSQGAIGKAVYTMPTDANGNFAITGVPAGSYELVVFDSNLDLVIALLPVTVNADGSCATATGSCNLNEVSVFNWFARMESVVFNDLDLDGFRDPGEAGIPEQGVNLRWRSGNLYQAGVTDTEGFVPFDQVFPFFHWLVAEVDFARFKATGATFVVDAGGPVLPDAGWDWPSRNVLTPQAQCLDDGTGSGATVGYDPVTGTCPPGSEADNPNTLNNLSRTEIGPVLTQGYQAFLGQTNVIEWGKAAYGAGENGGISGIVYYSTTRAEDDPELGLAEPWEAGIPRVPVNLYQDNLDNATGASVPDGLIDDRNGDGLLDINDAILTTTTDSWDDSQPTGCQGETFYGGEDLNGDGIIDDADVAIDPTRAKATDCYDGLRNFNQLRPGVFDGGYAFGPAFDCVTDLGGTCPDFVTIPDPVNAPNIAYLSTGTYIVETVPPAGYEIVKSQDKNVDFGDDYVPSLLLTPPPCVNWADVDNDLLPGYTVPGELTLFPGVLAPLAGQQLPLCDQKHVVLTDSVNAAADFFLFTETPIAAHFAGMILDDTANEFNPASPQFGEKYAPPFLPVSFRDWTGREIVRVYADEWGRYNGLVPSTYTQNLPLPSGTSPNMLTACMNDAGPILDTRVDSPTFGQMITDPNFNRQYSQFCYTFQYMPGITTYLDTPVVPVSAFAGPDQFQLDCELPSATPRIASVSGPLGGPFVLAAGDLVTITSMGSVEVPNPAYDGPNGTQPKTILRDYGFGGTEGTVSIGGVTIDPANVVWAADGGSISFAVPVGLTTGELIVTRADGNATPVGVTLWVDDPADPLTVHQVMPSTDPLARPIQDAIDLAGPGDLILVAPGNYPEMVVMWKPVRLQGWGEGTTIINASQSLADRLLQQRQTIATLLTNELVDLLPAQAGVFDPNAIEPNVLRTEEGAAILVLAKEKEFDVDKNGIPFGRIDGLTITGSSGGGGIMVNGYANDLEISNNVVVGNQGFFGGGIRIGHPTLFLETNQGLVYQDSFNERIRIHHNSINRNGGLGGTGGGVSLHTGADDYAVTSNFICGNFTMGEGGGIGHLGLVEDGKDDDTYGGVIANNRILFNQNFNQTPGSWNGGGVFITGGPNPNGPDLLSIGSGSVLIDANLFQGNLAGAGDGGAIALLQVNGADVEASKKPEDWYTVDVFNNMIANNVAGLAGGAIALKDTTRSNILHNTIAFNDSTATAGLAFTPGIPNQSNPQPAGIVSRAHSALLFAAIDGKVEPPFNTPFSNPRLEDNIIWHNRSFYVWVDDAADPPFYGLIPDVEGLLGVAQPEAYWDLAVLGVDGFLNPMYGILTSLTDEVLSANGAAGPIATATGHVYDASNLTLDPLFVAEYTNGARNAIQQIETKTAIQVQPALDEGGNFIDVRFGPLTTVLEILDAATPAPNVLSSVLIGDYHVQAGSPAIDAGNANASLDYPLELGTDYDGEPRPQGTAVDIGADEAQ